MTTPGPRAWIKSSTRGNTVVGGCKSEYFRPAWRNRQPYGQSALAEGRRADDNQLKLQRSIGVPSSRWFGSPIFTFEPSQHIGRTLAERRDGFGITTEID